MKSYRLLLYTFSIVFLLNIVQANQFWGAVYVDKNTKIAGGAYNMDSEDEAIQVAKSSCIKKHQGKKNNCKLVTTFYNGCVSLYMGTNGKGGWGFNGYGTRDATILALESCQEEGGKGCKEVLTFCTSRYY